MRKEILHERVLIKVNRRDFPTATYPLSGVNNYLLSLKNAHNYKK